MTLQYAIRTTFLVLFFGLQAVGFSQESVLTASSSDSSGTGRVTWSVGQIFYHTWNSAEGILEEGLQHPYEGLFPDAIGDDTLSGPGLRLYPNPALREVTLELNEPGSLPASWQIIDNHGLVSNRGFVVTSPAIISLESLPSGILYMIVETGRHVRKTWKIIKY